MTTERLKIPYPILVEGKYDRLRLLSVADADIYTTDGFGIFKKDEKKQLLLALSKKTKIIVLADSDGAGKVIRGYVSSLIPKDRLIPLYVPQIVGKEKRKAEYSKEGFLGVEGMERELLYELLLPYSSDAPTCSAGQREITKTDLYLDGFTGGENSAFRRDRFAESLGLPRGMTPNALLAALNALFTYEEYQDAAKRFSTRDSDLETEECR